MASPQQPKGRDGVISTLDVFIQAINVAKDTCGIPPAQIAFGSASVLLTMIRVRFLAFDESQPLTSRLSRTRWPTTRIMSTLDRRAAMYAKFSTGN